MTELTFSAGQRATLDLRDSAGAVALKDWDEPTIKIASDGDASPFVLHEGDTFRVRLDGGGTITLPAGLPAEVLVPGAVQLRVLRVTRAGGETVVRPVATERAAGAAEEHQPEPPPGTPDLTEFARLMSEQGRRIFSEMARAMRAGGTGTSDEAARRLDEAAERIDERVRRVAESVQREAERWRTSVERAHGHARRAAEHAEAHAKRAAEHAAERAERRAARWEDMGRRVEERMHARAEDLGRRAAARAGRGRWWFTERRDEAPAERGARPSAEPPRATAEERLTILRMLQQGKITPDQADKLLDALGG